MQRPVLRCSLHPVEHEVRGRLQLRVQRLPGVQEPAAVTDTPVVAVAVAVARAFAQALAVARALDEHLLETVAGKTPANSRALTQTNP